MTPLRVAVIGAGNIAQQHLPVLLAHPDCEVALLCDSDPATLARTAQRLRSMGGAEGEGGPQAGEPGGADGGGEGELRHPELVTEVGDVLRRDDLDAAFVLVSVLAVSAVAGACLEAGLPTFVEKPPGIASAETARLAELQQRRGTVAVVGLNRRFYSSHLAARERLLALGPLATVTVEAHEDLARVSREKFPPLVLRRWAYANGIHALDLLRFFGGEVTEVLSRQETVEGPFPDSFSALLRFASGASGRAAVDWMAPGRHRFEVRGVGARATSLGGLGSTELALRGREPEVLEPDADDRRFKAGFWKQDGAFLAGVRAGRQPPFPSPSLADAHATMVLLDRLCGLPAAAEGDGA
jgi:predicted dehydrogenase